VEDVDSSGLFKVVKYSQYLHCRLSLSSLCSIGTILKAKCYDSSSSPSGICGFGTGCSGKDISRSPVPVSGGLWPLLGSRGACAAAAGLEVLSLGLRDLEVDGAEFDVEGCGHEMPGVLDQPSDRDSD